MAGNDKTASFEHWAELENIAKFDGDQDGPGQYKVRRTQGVVEWLRRPGALGKGRVLELGCATGRNLVALKETYDVTVKGVDINPAMVERAQSRLSEPDEVVCANLYTDLECLKAHPDGHFDVGISVNFLQCLPPGPEKKALVKEFLRVCKTGIIWEAYDPSKPELTPPGPGQDGNWLASEDYTKYSSRIKREPSISEGHEGWADSFATWKFSSAEKKAGRPAKPKRAVAKKPATKKPTTPKVAKPTTKATPKRRGRKPKAAK